MEEEILRDIITYFVDQEIARIDELCEHGIQTSYDLGERQAYFKIQKLLKGEEEND